MCLVLCAVCCVLCAVYWILASLVFCMVLCVGFVYRIFVAGECLIPTGDHHGLPMVVPHAAFLTASLD